MKTQFEVLEYNLELITELANNANDFSTMWSNYLFSAGWSEDDFEIELNNRIFSKSN